VSVSEYAAIRNLSSPNQMKATINDFLTPDFIRNSIQLSPELKERYSEGSKAEQQLILQIQDLANQAVKNFE
jgi:hypothetical protein